jgi:hypothetical protein
MQRGNKPSKSKGTNKLKPEARTGCTDYEYRTLVVEKTISFSELQCKMRLDALAPTELEQIQSGSSRTLECKSPTHDKYWVVLVGEAARLNVQSGMQFGAFGKTSLERLLIITKPEKGLKRFADLKMLVLDAKDSVVDTNSILPLTADGAKDVFAGAEAEDLLMKLEDGLCNWIICDPEKPVKDIVKGLCSNKKYHTQLIEEGDRFSSYIDKMMDDAPLATNPPHKTLDIFPTSIKEDTQQSYESQTLGICGWQNYLLDCKVRARGETGSAVETVVIFNHKTYDDAKVPDPVVVQKERDRLMIQTYIKRLADRMPVDGSFALLYNTRKGQTDLVETDHYRLYQVVEARNQYVLHKLEYMCKWNVELEFSIQQKAPNVTKNKNQERKRPNNNQHRENTGGEPFYSNVEQDWNEGYEPLFQPPAPVSTIYVQIPYYPQMNQNVPVQQTPTQQSQPSPIEEGRGPNNPSKNEKKDTPNTVQKAEENNPKAQKNQNPNKPNDAPKKEDIPVPLKDKQNVVKKESLKSDEGKDKNEPPKSNENEDGKDPSKNEDVKDKKDLKNDQAAGNQKEPPKKKPPPTNPQEKKAEWQTIDEKKHKKTLDHENSKPWVDEPYTYLSKKDGKEIPKKNHHNHQNRREGGKLETEKLDEVKVGCCLALLGSYEISGAVAQNINAKRVNIKPSKNVKVIADYKIELRYEARDGEARRTGKQGGKFKIVQNSNCSSQTELVRKVMNGVFGPLITKYLGKLVDPTPYSVKLVPEILSSRLALINSTILLSRRSLPRLPRNCGGSLQRFRTNRSEERGLAGDWQSTR